MLLRSNRTLSPVKNMLLLDSSTLMRNHLEPLPGVKPYPALQLAGRDIYVREGCYNCHSQMVRTLRFETERYGHYSLAGESVYDRPFQWGSKRTGPDLARVGGRYSDDWHRVHLTDPRAVVPESNSGATSSRSLMSSVTVCVVALPAASVAVILML